MNTTLKIGELARRTGCPAQTIRYYERAELLPPPLRSEGNYRLYGEAHVERLDFIRRCRSLDMALEEIRVLLRVRDSPEEDCEAVNALVEAHIGHISARLDELRQLQTQLRDLSRRCATPRPARECGILNELAKGDGAHPRAKGATRHVAGTHSH